MKKSVFFENASWIMIGRGVQLGLTFVTTMLVSRYLGPQENGKLIYVYSYIQLFLPMCTLGLNDIAVKELVDQKDRNEEIPGTMLVIRMTSSLTCMFCSIALVAALNHSEIYTSIAVLQSFSLLFQSFDCLMYFFQSKMLSSRSGAAYALAYILSSAYRFYAIFTHKDIRYFAFAYSLDFIATALFLLLAYRFDHHSFKFSLTAALELLKKSRHYIVAGIMIVLYGKVTDVLLLGKMVDDTAVGYYGAATTLCNAWPFVLTALIDSANPMIIELHSKDIGMYKKRLRQLYAAVFYISVLAAVAIGLLSDVIINILYGNEYMPASLILKIFSWNTAFSYLGVARTAWMQCENMTKYESLISFFGAFFSIVLNYALIRRFNIAGAAIAAVLTQFLTNYVLLYVIKDTRENARLITDAILLKGVLK